MSPWVTWRRSGYCDEIELSFDGVRARILTLCPAAREFFKIARPVPPVAPKMAIEGFSDEGAVDIVSKNFDMNKE